ncbi:MAG TPA: response regulator [Planctomycetaceae bacterium]|nr:response regulator [Planctomycetaceae bacterium]
MKLTPESTPPLPATVYVVDDDPAVRKSLRWLIESVGLPVKTFASGSEFLEQYDSRHPGCLVLDVRMPGMSGLELQEKLREYGRHLPIIVMTAFGDVPMAVRAMKFGAVYFFEKPVKDQELLDHIQAALLEDARWRERAQHDDVVRCRHQRLTKRECQVLQEVVGGLSSKEIGGKLGVSFKTVEAHRAKIMKKMEADSVPHLIRLYLSIQHYDDVSPDGRPDDDPDPPDDE